MSEMVSAQLSGELEDRFNAAAEDRGESISRSEFIRELIDDGLKKTEETIYNRLGCTDRLAAELEDEREPGENESEVVIRMLRDAINKRDYDSLDYIGANDDLRASIETLSDEGEPIDETVHRLLREGIDTANEEPRSIKTRVIDGLFVFTLSMLIVLSVLQDNPSQTFALVFLYSVGTALSDYIVDIVSRLPKIRI
jgi:Arc/MetJ-type ribon-helix-helix transcriptional regulator